ncbi:MAG TPA: peptidoglycan -binding protein [Candidatus Binatia bacterium]|nr:peptidoglycan -binding protein [Candidatus Binatia bacterium]
MARVRIRSYRTPDVWPGYVDALTTLLLMITFLLTVYILAQFFLSQVLSGREKALKHLSEEIAALTEQLTGERKAKQALEGETARLSSAVQAANDARAASEQRLAPLQSEIDRLNALVASTKAEGEGLAIQLADQKRAATDALSQIGTLNQQIADLRKQLGDIAAALDTSEKKNRDSQVVIADLGKRLEVALAQKVAEMARYRSEFFGRLREVLGDRPEIRVVGDRFVFQSEVLFPSGSAELTAEGKNTLASFARTLNEITKKIPPDLPWVLRVDGHTDRVPISSGRYPSNWELSADRALSVVKYLITQGVAPKSLAATGFGEFQPIDAGKGAAANGRNRRIEMRLTDR